MPCSCTQHVSVYSTVQYNFICVICMCMLWLSYIVKYYSLVTTLKSHHEWSWIKMPSPSVHFQWSDILQKCSLCHLQKCALCQTIYTLCELESHLSYTVFVVYKENTCSYQAWLFFFFECSYYCNPHLTAALHNLGNGTSHTYILPV